MKKEIGVQQAIDTLCKALREDDDYYDTWKSNIAMSFHDEYYSKGKSVIEGEELHEVFNDAAERFLQILTRKPEEV